MLAATTTKLLQGIVFILGDGFEFGAVILPAIVMCRRSMNFLLESPNCVWAVVTHSKTTRRLAWQN